MSILTIGHSTLDTFVQIPKAHLHCKVDTNTCELCLNYADKIVVDKIHYSVGGNAANTAIGLGRLGIPTAILTYIGDDHASDQIQNELKAAGVNLQWLVQEKTGATDQSIILNYQGERTILAYHYPWIYKFPHDLPQYKWIYLTSLNENFKSFHQEFLAWYRASKGTVLLLAYNPGSHELRAGLKANSEILKICEVLILNKKEAETWAKIEKLHKAGPKIVIITDGENGSFAYDGKNYFEQKALPTKLIEATGAGDAFSTGALAALFQGQALQKALLWGSIEAASVIGQIGAIRGLLKKEELI